MNMNEQSNGREVVVVIPTDPSPHPPVKGD